MFPYYRSFYIDSKRRQYILKKQIENPELHLFQDPINELDRLVNDYNNFQFEMQEVENMLLEQMPHPGCRSLEFLVSLHDYRCPISSFLEQKIVESIRYSVEVYTNSNKLMREEGNSNHHGYPPYHPGMFEPRTVDVSLSIVSVNHTTCNAECFRSCSLIAIKSKDLLRQVVESMGGEITFRNHIFSYLDSYAMYSKEIPDFEGHFVSVYVTFENVWCALACRMGQRYGEFGSSGVRCWIVRRTLWATLGEETPT
tara:strand:- start:207 stop:971 length:765 start_codon:yes stop_codon:yes gene_type:complete